MHFLCITSKVHSCLLNPVYKDWKQVVTSRSSYTHQDRKSGPLHIFTTRRTDICSLAKAMGVCQEEILSYPLWMCALREEGVYLGMAFKIVNLRHAEFKTGERNSATSLGRIAPRQGRDIMTAETQIKPTHPPHYLLSPSPPKTLLTSPLAFSEAQRI